MQLPTYVVYDRTAQEISDTVDAFIRDRKIPAYEMELILHKVMNHVRELKEYDYANEAILAEQSKENAGKAPEVSDEQGL